MEKDLHFGYNNISVYRRVYHEKNMIAALCLAMVLFFVGCGKGDMAKV